MNKSPRTLKAHGLLRVCVRIDCSVCFRLARDKTRMWHEIKRNVDQFEVMGKIKNVNFRQ